MMYMDIIMVCRDYVKSARDVRINTFPLDAAVRMAYNEVTAVNP